MMSRFWPTTSNVEPNLLGSFSCPHGLLNLSDPKHISFLRDQSHRVCLKLDPDELFAQLCVSVKLVKPGPRRGLFAVSVDVSNAVRRVWRDWLVERASASGQGEGAEESTETLWLNDQQDVGIETEVTRTRTRRRSLTSRRRPQPGPSVSSESYIIMCKGIGVSFELR